MSTTRKTNTTLTLPKSHPGEVMHQYWQTSTEAKQSFILKLQIVTTALKKLSCSKCLSNVRSRMWTTLTLAAKVASSVTWKGWLNAGSAKGLLSISDIFLWFKSLFCLDYEFQFQPNVEPATCKIPSDVSWHWRRWSPVLIVLKDRIDV